MELEVRVDAGSGERRSARLACGPERPRATGFLAEDPSAACHAARRLAPLLTDEPDPDRICTQVYGGPQTARITGMIGARAIDRHLARRNGCEIAEWDRAAVLLGEGRRAEPPESGS